MQKLKMGIVGMGMAFEKLHYPAFQKLQDRYQITAISDVDKQKLDRWRGTLGLSEQDTYTDYKDMVEKGDIDAFFVMVPIELNFEVTEVVAKAGKPIICEKPLAPTMEQAEAARDLPKKYNIPVMIAENYRYNEEVNIIRDMIRTNKVGSPVYFMWNRVVDVPKDMLGNKFPAREWRQHPEFPGGIFYDTAVHDAAAMRHYFGAVDRLQSFGKKQDEDYSPYSVITNNIVFRNGVIGNYTFFDAGKEMQRPLIGLRIFCTNGMIYLEERDSGTINVTYNDGRSEQVPYIPQMGYYNQLVNFYNAATGKEPIAVTPEIEYGDARMILAMLESSREGKTMKVDDKEQYIPGYDAVRMNEGVQDYRQ